jgi:hypothetical protein
VRQVAVRRAVRGELPRFDLEVDLAEPDASGRLLACRLVPEREADIGLESGFRCDRAGGARQVEIGKVRFEPGAFTRPLAVSDRAADALRRGDPFQAQAELGGVVRLAAQGDQSELVRAFAGRHGADISIGDAAGRALFRLLADSTGASLRVRDETGREVVRLEAAAGRFELSVDTAGLSR